MDYYKIKEKKTKENERKLNKEYMWLRKEELSKSFAKQTDTFTVLNVAI